MAWSLGISLYDRRYVQIYRLLPKTDKEAFLQFIYPLRARAAITLALLLILYYLSETIALLATHLESVNNSYITKRVITVFLEIVLIFFALWGSPRVVSIAVHLWFVGSVVVRLVFITTASFEPGGVTGAHLLSSLCTVLIGLMSIGATMHVNFLLVVVACVPIAVVYVTVVQRSEVFDIEFSKSAATVYVVVMVVLSIWVVHTVQVQRVEKAN